MQVIGTWPISVSTKLGCHPQLKVDVASALVPLHLVVHVEYRKSVATARVPSPFDQRGRQIMTPTFRAIFVCNRWL